MRILHITDTHIAEQVGRRKMGYEPILAKWGWCATYASKHDIHHIVHTGDMFHKALVPRTVEQDVCHLVAQCPKFGLEHSFVVGNHDLGAGVQKTDGKSIHTLLMTQGVTCILPVTTWVYDNNDDIADPPQFQSDILLTHHMIVPEPVPWEHHVLTDLSAHGTKVVLCGDYHEGWPEPIFHDGAWWSNPGSLTRIDKDKQVRCALVDIADDGSEASVEYITLPAFDEYNDPVVLPWEEVYDAGGLEQEKKLLQVRQSLTAAIKSAGERNLAGYEERLQSILDAPLQMGDKYTAEMIIEGTKALLELCTQLESD